MMPENQVARKRPYVLMPPTSIPSDGGRFAATGGRLTGDETLSFQIGFRETESVAQTISSVAHGTTGPLPLALGLLLFLVLPSALGCVAGFHLAVQWASDSTTWSIVGGAAGLVLGGVCLLWNRSKG